MEEDTLALAIVTIPAAVPPNVTVSLVLAGHRACSDHKNPCCCRSAHPEATLLQTDHVPAWCWHSATEVLLESLCVIGVHCVGPTACLQETKMVTPSDPNGQQFTLPGQAGRVMTSR